MVGLPRERFSGITYTGKDLLNCSWHLGRPAVSRRKVSGTRLMTQPAMSTPICSRVSTVMAVWVQVSSAVFSRPEITASTGAPRLAAMLAFRSNSKPGSLPRKSVPSHRTKSYLEASCLYFLRMFS